MELAIVTRPAMRVIGIAQRLDPLTTDWGALWRQQFEPCMPVLGPLMTGPNCYGLYWDTDQPPQVDFVGAVEVAPAAEAPAGLVARDVPGGAYACFECAMDAIGPTWEAIFGEWLPGDAHTHDPSRPCFEEFGPGSEEGRSPVRIYVPVQSKG